MDLDLITQYKQLFDVLEYTPTSDDIFKIADRALLQAVSCSSKDSVKNDITVIVKNFIADNCHISSNININTVTTTDFVARLLGEHGNLKRTAIHGTMKTLGYKRNICKLHILRDKTIFPTLQWKQQGKDEDDIEDEIETETETETELELEMELDLEAETIEDEKNAADQDAIESIESIDTDDEDEQEGQITVYCLELEDGHYYIGRTTPDGYVRRIARHHSKKATPWTTLHAFVKVTEVIDDATIFEEDNKTLEYMIEHGVDKVRGGQYTTMTLSTSDKASIARAISSAENRCFTCNSDTHFASACPKRRKHRRNAKSSNRCSRCHRNTHTARNCFAHTALDGTPLES